MGKSWRTLTTAPVAVPDRVAETGSGAVALGIVDIVGSGNWLNELGDQRYGALLDRLKDIWTEAIARHGARLVSDTGDGCIFVHEAVDVAVAVSREMHVALDGLPVANRVQTRHAVHHGPVVDEFDGRPRALSEVPVGVHRRDAR